MDKDITKITTNLSSAIFYKTIWQKCFFDKCTLLKLKKLEIQKKKFISESNEDIPKFQRIQTSAWL